MFALFSRNFFFLVFLFSFLFLLTPLTQASTSTNPPGAPGKPTVTGGSQQVTLAASVSDNGGSAVTGWKYQQKVDGGSYGSWTEISNSSSGNLLSGTVTGLQNGTAYRFKVRAVNANGDGAESPESDAVTPATTPGAPGKPTVTGGNQQVTLAASVSSNGGSAVTGWKYQQKVDGGSYGSWTEISNSSSGNSLSGTVTGLQNGTAYKFKVRAVNGNGDGAESPESDAVTPAACASSLTGVKASGSFVDYGYDREFTIKVSWDEVPNAAYTVIWENSRPQNLPYAGQFGPADKSYYEIDGNKIFYIIPGHKSNEGSVTYMISVTAIVDGCEDVSYGPVTVSTGGGSRNNVPAPSAPDGGGNSDDTCPGYSPVVTAHDVERLKDPETLAAFVKEARAGIGTLLGDTVSEGKGIRNLVRCFGADGDWKHGSVHLFMISADENKKFFLAPEDSELAGTPLDIEDENGCDVGEEILRAAGGEELQCDDLGLAGDDPEAGFVQYLWRDPDDPDSEDYDLPKLSYVEEIRFERFLPSMSFVLGSGYYPEISVPEPGGETSGSGGGCALVAETDARNGAAVGLFLSAFVLGSVVFLRRGVFPRRG